MHASDMMESSKDRDCVIYYVEVCKQILYFAQWQYFSKCWVHYKFLRFLKNENV